MQTSRHVCRWKIDCQKDEKTGPRGCVQEMRNTSPFEPPTFCFPHKNYVGGSCDIHASLRTFDKNMGIMILKTQ